jgi:uncharacterized protein (DUF2141 family)
MNSIVLFALPALWVFLTSVNEGSASAELVDESSALTIEIRGVRSSKGQIGILVFNKENGFPSTAEQAIHKGFVPARLGSFTHEVKGLATGKMAVALMHDENNNSLLDTNFLGIPKEGTGVSNNVTAYFGPPEFGDCAFDFTRSGQRIVIEIKY